MMDDDDTSPRLRPLRPQLYPPRQYLRALLSAPMADHWICRLGKIKQTIGRSSYFLSNEDFVTQAYLKEMAVTPSETEGIKLGN